MLFSFYPLKYNNVGLFLCTSIFGYRFAKVDISKGVVIKWKPFLVGIKALNFAYTSDQRGIGNVYRLLRAS